MGRKCCVPNCRGNYDDQSRVSVFTFPKDEEKRRLWLNKIPRHNFVPSAQSVVCEQHFREDFVIRIDSVRRPDGSVLTMPREKPKLAEDAYPSIFLNCPNYLTENTPLKRKKPEDRRHELEQRDANSFVEWLEADRINNFANFSNDFTKRVDSKWNYRLHHDIEDCVKTSSHVDTQHWSLYRIQESNLHAPRLLATVKIFTDMHVEIFTDKAGRIPNNSLSWIFEQCSPPILKAWSQFDTILSYFSSGQCGIDSSDINKKLTLLVETSEEMCENLEEGESTINRDKLLFLIQQIKLSMSSVKRYSCSTLLWAFKIYASSPRSYTMIRSTFLTLPHPSYLRKLSSVFQIRSGLKETNVHEQYLKQKCLKLTPAQRSVVLMLDEIHISHRLSYKEGKLEGSAVNCPITEASTAQVFMISSLLSKSKDVVAIVPVKNIDAVWLSEAIMNVLKMLHFNGFSVVCVISDNNRVNRNAFTIISGGSLQTSIPHPLESSQRLFFMFDSVHLFKCIRNNWLVQKDVEKTFMFTPFITQHDSSSSVIRSSFSHLKRLYNEEKCSTVKLAPSLTYKSLHPTAMEKQNVKLMLNIFDRRNVTALEHYEKIWKIDTNGTREFLSFIIKLWNIFNVKHPFKSVRLRDESCKIISSDDDLDVVRQAVSWLENWRSLNLKSREGCLSNDTMTALSHTLSASVDLCRYLLQEKEYKYVLLGKFQTDDLEFRFSQYRQMSGCNFHVSVEQLLEGEKKLKLLSILKLISASNGSMKLKDITIPLEETKNQIDLISCDNEFMHFTPMLCDCDNIQVSDEQLKVLIFIAGYCILKLMRETECTTCKNDLSIGRQLEVETTKECYSYISALDRCGLTWPSDYVLEIVTEVFKVFQFLIGSDGHEKVFFSCCNQQLLLMRLVKQRLADIDLLGRKCQECEKDHGDLISKFCKPAINIFLNNYSKSLTDKVSSSKNERKLKTFTKRI